MLSFLKWTLGFIFFCAVLAAFFGSGVFGLNLLHEKSGNYWYVALLLLVLVAEWRIIVDAVKRLSQFTSSPSPYDQNKMDLYKDATLILGSIIALVVSLVWLEAGFYSALIWTVVLGLTRFKSKTQREPATD